MFWPSAGRTTAWAVPVVATAVIDAAASAAASAAADSRIRPDMFTSSPLDLCCVGFASWNPRAGKRQPPPLKKTFCAARSGVSGKCSCNFHGGLRRPAEPRRDRSPNRRPHPVRCPAPGHPRRKDPESQRSGRVLTLDRLPPVGTAAEVAEQRGHVVVPVFGFEGRRIGAERPERLDDAVATGINSRASSGVSGEG